MDESSIDQRRWFRFSLRTLLAVVALVAVLGWIYWVGWPLWRMHREQQKFESAVQRLRIGIDSDEAHGPLARDLLSLHWNNAIYTWTFGSHHSGLMEYDWPNAVYFIYFVFRDKIDASNQGLITKIPWLSVEVYRLPKPPSDYAARTAGGRMMADLPADSAFERARTAYRYDFLDFMSGDRKNEPGFQGELIYSDLPQK